MSSQKHTYDEADRLTDTGTKYNEFGDITGLPAADAGGKEASEELTSTYYTDNQLASQTQNGETIGYNLDPDGRTLETVATGKRAETVTNHYAGSGSGPAWTVNTSGETTRNIAGISGFAAVQNNSETPVLQITNLHGDIIGTAYLSETATALASSADTSEFGVPTTSLPPKYSWLGADEIPTELPSGVLNMGARSYVPQLGRFLQPDPIPGGSANAYSYTFGNPVNESDPSGEWTFGLPAWLQAADAGWSAREAGAEAVRAAERKAAEEAAARAYAEKIQAIYAEVAAVTAEREAANAAGGGEEEWGEEEYWEEEWGEEKVAFHPGEGKQANPLMEEGLLFHSESEEGSGANKHVVVLCVERSKATGRPCVRYVHWYSGPTNWVNKHIIRPAKSVWNSTVRYVVRGASDAWKATGATFSTVKQGLEVGVREYFDDGGPPP